MGKINSLIIAGCLVAAVAAAQSPFIVSVNTQSPGLAIPPDFTGVSFGPSALRQGVFNATNTQVLTLFHQVGIQYFRMGGTWVDTNSYNYVPSIQDIDTLFGFIQAAGLKDVIYTLRLENGDPSEDAFAAAHIWDNYHDCLTCFAIGNEPNLYNGGDPAITNFSSYLAKWSTFAAAITNAVPEATFGGPDTGVSSSWTASFINAEAGSSIVTRILAHWYVGGTARGLTAQEMIDGMLSSTWVTTKYPARYDSLAVLAAANGFPFRFTEANSYSNGNAPGGSDSFATALFALDFLHWWAQAGCEGVGVHTGLSNLNGAIYQDAQGNWQAFPFSYGIKAFNIGGQGNVDPIAIGNPDDLNLTAYAVSDTNHDLFVTVINKEHGTGARDAAVNIRPVGFASGTVSAMFLTAASGNVSATNGITLGGAPITNNGPWTGRWTPMGVLTNSQYALTLRAGSAAIVKISPARPIQSPVFQAINRLDPVGYWPMHETEPAVPGNIETNYGTLGLPGTGYYSDWEVAGATRICRGLGGALAGDSDSAVYFASARANQTSTTNALCVPRTSPLATLNPPFSIECWFYATNSVLQTNSQGDILGQSAYEGLNAGNNGGGNGDVCGIRLYWNSNPSGGSFIIQSYANSSVNHPLVSSGGYTTNQWYHVVITADTSTNVSLYVDGKLKGTSAAAGLYLPDPWMPFEVGNSRGNTHPLNGVVDEVAVYTNALSAPVIADHYSAGTNAAASPGYFQVVTDDHPLIYLRMDSPVAAPPPAYTWPLLLNYGSAGLNGVYTPGTLPGIVPGPVAPDGTPFGGMNGARVPQFSGVSSYADAGYAPAFDPTGPTPFAVTALFRGNPADGRLQTIVGHANNSWSLSLNSNGRLQWRLGPEPTGQLTSTGIYNDGNWHQAVAVYEPASDPSIPGTNALYVDGTLDILSGGVTTNGIGPGSAADVLIGADPQYTNNPPGLGRQFAGQICEVALFTNALTAAQVQEIYQATTNIPPVTLTFQNPGANQLQLDWDSGILQSATNVAGPYNDVTNAIPPCTIQTTNSRQFYRVRRSY